MTPPQAHAIVESGGMGHSHDRTGSRCGPEFADPACTQISALSRSRTTFGRKSCPGLAEK
jgi:hypothetical protein